MLPLLREPKHIECVPGQKLLEQKMFVLILQRRRSKQQHQDSEIVVVLKHIDIENTKHISQLVHQPPD